MPPPRRLAPLLGGLGLALGLAVGLSACRPGATTNSVPDSAAETANGPEWFEDATDAVGLDFVQDPGPTDTFFSPQSMGSGCAALDFDGDGLIDIYLLNSAGPDSKSVNRLYRQMPGGKFRDVTEGSGLGVAGWNQGVAVGDVNNDGLPDVLLTRYGGKARLFLNQGGGKFRDVTEESGLNNPMWGASAAFFDYDRDGWLDLVIVNYVDYDPKKECFAPNGTRDFCGPSQFSTLPTKLFRNRGPSADGDKPRAAVRFEDVSFQSGVGSIPGPGLGVYCADFDGDGWQDVFVANDGEANRLWMNQHDGTFKEEAASRGVALTFMGKAYAGMGVAVGDVNNDGLFDLYVTHLNTETNTLWQQGPRGRFRDRTTHAQLLGTRWHGTGFGALMADFDLDGAVDIAVANGRVYLGSPAKGTDLGFWETYADRNQLFANDGAGKFRDVSEANKVFCGRWNVARGLAVADFDNDGAPDLLLTTIGNRARLYRNVAPNRGHWLTVRAFDPKLNRDAYGAEVRVRAGGTERLRVVNAAQSYYSSSSPLAYFGLGASDKMDSVLVNWPDGSREEFPGGPADRSIVLKKGEGRAP